MFNDDDFMGGIFDFDGNGKTTLDEQYVAYKIYEETTKEESENKSSSYKPVFSPKKSTKTSVSKSISIQQSIPEWMTYDEYKKRYRLFLKDVILSLAVATIMCLPLGVVIWASIAAYDEKNSAGIFVILILSLVAFAGIIIILKEALSNITKSSAHFQKEKEVFLKTATKDEIKKQQKETIRRRVLGFSIIGIVVVVISVILFMSNSNISKDSSYKSSYQKSYSYSSSTSYPSRTSSTSTTSKLYSSSSSYSSYSSSGKSKSYSSRSKSSSKSKDEYNAKDYYHAEDFYEDHYDDFFDYEDAEDYYNDHYND